MGFIVSKPFGEDARYDFVVDRKGKLYRVQVKGTNAAVNAKGDRYKLFSAYGCKPQKNYCANDIDYIAGYIAPLNLWYIIPVSAIGTSKSINIFPNDPNCQFAKYKSLWDMKPQRTCKKATGDVYTTKWGFQVRYGRKISRHFKDKAKALEYLERVRFCGGNPD
jgi:hypothetical protein